MNRLRVVPPPCNVSLTTKYWTSANLPALAWNALAAAADGHRWIADSGAGSGLYLGSSRPEPVLQIASRGAGIVISWIVASSPFILQQKFDLTIGNWSVTPGTPTLNFQTLRNELFAPATSDSSFFRLSSP